MIIAIQHVNREAEKHISLIRDTKAGEKYKRKRKIIICGVVDDGKPENHLNIYGFLRRPLRQNVELTLE